MRNRGAWGMAAVLALGIITGRGWCDDSINPETAPKLTLWQRITGQKPKPEKLEAPPEVTARQSRQSFEQARAIRAREEAAWHRRSEACLRLMELAIQRDDLQLQKQAQELEERAWKVYLQRTSNLAITREIGIPTPQILEQKLQPNRIEAARALQQPSTQEKKEAASKVIQAQWKGTGQ